MSHGSGFVPDDPLLTLGLMTGTSLDGIDACLLASSADGQLQLLATERADFPEGLRERLLAALSAEMRLDDMLILEKDYSLSLLPCLQALCERAPGPVAAAGIHGQTLRHWPELGISYQALQPEWISEALGLPVVFNFRVADVAAGGQGAPLVPPFHRALLQSSQPPEMAQSSRPQAMLNLGGIANVTLLMPDGQLLGYDTGPANVLLDLWAERVLGTRMDLNGQLAARGRVHQGLLSRLLSDPYFAQRGPRSTGRERFHNAWLCRMLSDEFGAWDVAASKPGSGQREAWQWAADVAATLAALTIQSVGLALCETEPEGPARLVVSGGGARNPHLMQGLAEALPHTEVVTSEALGWPADQIEAAAFAWLAAEHLRGRPANAPAVTGAKGPRILGQLAPAPSPTH